jgi:hypothetical protein
MPGAPPMEMMATAFDYLAKTTHCILPFFRTSMRQIHGLCYTISVCCAVGDCHEFV